jgi:hypothetical protein
LEKPCASFPTPTDVLVESLKLAGVQSGKEVAESPAPPDRVKKRPAPSFAASGVFAQYAEGEVLHKVLVEGTCPSGDHGHVVEVRAATCEDHVLGSQIA